MLAVAIISMPRAAMGRLPETCNQLAREETGHKHGQHMPLYAHGRLAHAVAASHHRHGGGRHQKAISP